MLRRIPPRRLSAAFLAFRRCSSRYFPGPGDFFYVESLAFGRVIKYNSIKVISLITQSLTLIPLLNEIDLPRSILFSTEATMRIIEESFVRHVEMPKTFDMYFGGCRGCTLDIETTGLSPFSDSVILAGACFFDERAKTVQFFADTPADENELLQRTAELMTDADYVVTYNGKFFDMPFLKRRAAKYGIHLPEVYNLDLFPLIKYYSDLPSFLPDLRQKTIEAYYGAHGMRLDEISGGESVDMYERYLDTGSTVIRDTILLHNADDVRQLACIMPIIGKTDIHRAFARQGFPFSGGTISSVTLKKLDLIIKGTLTTPIDYINFPMPDRPYTFRASSSDASFTLEIPCEKNGEYVFTDAEAVLGSDERLIKKYPSSNSGYLIISQGKDINFAEMNIFAALAAEHALAI